MQPLVSPKFFNTRTLFRLFALSLNPIGSAYNFAADAKNLYKNVEFFLQIFQTAALLEVLHAAVGLVRSNAVLVFLQVLSR